MKEEDNNKSGRDATTDEEGGNYDHSYDENDGDDDDEYSTTSSTTTAAYYENVDYDHEQHYSNTNSQTGECTVPSILLDFHVKSNTLHRTYGHTNIPKKIGREMHYVLRLDEEKNILQLYTIDNKNKNVVVLSSANNSPKYAASIHKISWEHYESIMKKATDITSAANKKLHKLVKTNPLLDNNLMNTRSHNNNQQQKEDDDDDDHSDNTSDGEDDDHHHSNNVRVRVSEELSHLDNKSSSNSTADNSASCTTNIHRMTSKFDEHIKNSHGNEILLKGITEKSRIIKFDNNDEKILFLEALSEIKNKELSHYKDIGLLNEGYRIEIIGCENLPKADRFGTIDAFVKAVSPVHQSSTTFATTKYISQTRNPIFSCMEDYDFLLTYPDLAIIQRHGLKFEIYDYSVTHDRLVATAITSTIDIFDPNLNGTRQTIQLNIDTNFQKEVIKQEKKYQREKLKLTNTYKHKFEAIKRNNNTVSFNDDDDNDNDNKLSQSVKANIVYTEQQDLLESNLSISNGNLDIDKVIQGMSDESLRLSYKKFQEEQDMEEEAGSKKNGDSTTAAASYQQHKSLICRTNKKPSLSFRVTKLNDFLIKLYNEVEKRKTIERRLQKNQLKKIANTIITIQKSNYIYRNINIPHWMRFKKHRRYKPTKVTYIENNDDDVSSASKNNNSAIIRRTITKTKTKQVRYLLQPNCTPPVYMTKEELWQNSNSPTPSDKWIDLRKNTMYMEYERQDDFGTLYVEVLRCKGLPNFEVTGLLSKTSAFVQLAYGRKVGQTSNIRNCLNPQWPTYSQRAFKFALGRSSTPLNIGVFGYQDGDLVPHEFAGRNLVNIALLAADVEYTQTLPLFRKALEDDDCVGKYGYVTIRISKSFHNAQAVRSQLIAAPINLINGACFAAYKMLVSPTTLNKTLEFCHVHHKKQFQTLTLTVYGQDYAHEQGFSLANMTRLSEEMLSLFEHLYPVILDGLAKLILWRIPILSLSTLITLWLFLNSPLQRLVPCFSFLSFLLLQSINVTKWLSLNPWDSSRFFLDSFTLLVFGRPSMITIKNREIQENQNADAINAAKAKEKKLKEEKLLEAKRREELINKNNKEYQIELKGINQIEIEDEDDRKASHGFLSNVSPTEKAAEYFLKPYYPHLQRFVLNIRIIVSMIDGNEVALNFFLMLMFLLLTISGFFVPWGMIFDAYFRFLLLLSLGPQNLLVDKYLVKTGVLLKEYDYWYNFVYHEGDEVRKERWEKDVHGEFARIRENNESIITTSRQNRLLRGKYALQVNIFSESVPENHLPVVAESFSVKKKQQKTDATRGKDKVD